MDTAIQLQTRALRVERKMKSYERDKQASLHSGYTVYKIFM